MMMNLRTFSRLVVRSFATSTAVDCDYLVCGKSVYAAALSLALRQTLPQDRKIIYLESPEERTRGTTVHLLNRNSREILVSLLELQNEEPLQLVGHRVEAVNFYDQKISSQISFSNQLWKETQKCRVLGAMKKFGWNFPEREQSALSIRDDALQQLLNAKLKEAKCAPFVGKVVSIHDGVVGLEDGTLIRPKIVLAARINKVLNDYAGIEMKSTFYQQRVASSFCSLAENLKEAYIRTFPGGFVSLVPLDNNQVYLRYCHGEEEDISKLSKSSYVELINNKLQQVSERDTQPLVSTPLSYPPLIVDEISDRTENMAMWRQATKLYARSKDVVLFADAAHEFYPFLLHDSNICFNEVSCLSRFVARGSLKHFNSSAQAIAYSYGNVQHYLSELVQSDSSWTKCIHAAGVGLLNLFPAATYLVNELAHGPSASLHFLDMIGKLKQTVDKAAERASSCHKQ